MTEDTPSSVSVVTAPGEPVLRYQVLGGLAVLRDGAAVHLRGRKLRVVLAALLLRAGQAVAPDRLVEQVWGSDPPARAAASLQAYVSRLRRLLEPGQPHGGAHAVLVTEPDGYRLAAAPADVDLLRFDRLVTAASQALASGDVAAAAQHYDEALALHRPLLPELAGVPWVDEAAFSIERAHADTLEGAAEAKLALGGGRELVAGLETAVKAHPYRERLRGSLALALYRAGRQTDALRSLAEARRTLAEEIGVEPSPELRRLEADILSHAEHLSPQRPEPRVAVQAPAAAPEDPPVTASPHGHGGPVAMVGRESELASLVEAARAATAGRGRAVVVSGDPGIGKTRLVEELVATLAPAGDRGPVVAWVRCLESASSAPFWAYTQIAEQLRAPGVIDDTARQAVSAVGGGVHTIDPAADRLALHTSIVGALRSGARPLVVAVDDLQWADPSSLRLLEFVGGALPTLPLLVAATVRPVHPESPPALVSCLGELVRHAGSQHLELGGLSADEVATWIRRHSATPVPDEVVQLVHQRTAGNPFFVGELVELLAREKRLTDPAAARAAGVPPAALDVVRRRVGLLPAATQQLLAVGSILGVRMDVDVLARVAGLPVAEALDRLDPAVRAGLLVEDRSGPGRLQFAHALVADALATELGPGRRARLHAAVVAAIEDLRSATLAHHLPALVHHGREGAPAGTAARAFDHAAAAARAASDQAAFETAAAYWKEARGLLDLARPADTRARYGVLVELGSACLRADDLGGAQDALVDAVDAADALGDRDAARRAASALAAGTLWRTNPYGVTNAQVVATLERILAGVPDTDSPERSRLVGALADAVYYQSDPTRSLRLSAEAVAIARRTGDAPTLALALNQRFRAIWRDTSATEQRLLADEMVALAERGAVGPDLAGLAYLARAVTAITHADRRGFEADLSRTRALAEESGLPGLLSMVGWAEATWLVALGRYDDAVARAGETHPLYRRTRGWDAEDILTTFEVSIAHDRGRLAEVLDDALALAGGAFGLAARELLAETGQHDRARALVGPVGSVPDPPPDWLWFETTTAAALARAALGDRAACAELHERLAPFPGRLELSAGPFLGGTDLALACTAAVLDDRASALRHATAAVETLDRIDARPALARALLVLGRLLDAPAALDRSRAIAEGLGLVPVLDALDRL